MLAAASFQPHRVGEAVGPLNTESWALEASRGTPQHAMKLLDLDSVRSLMLRNLDVCRKRRPTLSGSQVLTHVPEIDSDPYYGAAGVADPSDVNRLLALDVEELVQHTYRLHRERRADAPVADKSKFTGMERKRRNGESSKTSGQASTSTRQYKTRRKRRRASRSLSPSLSGARPIVLSHGPSARSSHAPRNESIRARPLRMGLPNSEVQRMDAALRSARHDARLLSNHLKRALGKENQYLPESAARNVTTSLLAQGDTHGDLDTEKALRLSRIASSPLSSARAHGIKQDATRNDMDVEGDGNTESAAGSYGGEPLPSSHGGGQVDFTGVASPQEVVGVGDAKNTNATAARLREGGDEPSNAGSVVNPRRLIAILEAEERISAMANHLGSVDAMINLRSVMLPEQPSSISWLSRGVAGFPAGHQPQCRDMSSQSMVLCDSLAYGEAVANLTATATHPSKKGTEGFPLLSGDSNPSQGNGEPAQRKQRRSRSAEDYIPTRSTTEPWDGCVAGESKHGRKKRSREGETADQSEDLVGLGLAESCLNDGERPGLGRSSSFTTIQQQETLAPQAGVNGSSSFCSLPKLKASRLNCGHSASDDFDRFGGRETPTVLRRNSLSGGGEDSKRAVEELRQQLEITEGGLLDLRARVRADVAWVQETVGAKMSRRARASCCKWGSEKAAELAHRWERRSLGKAIATWTRHREYMANRDLVRAFMKRKGAAQARRLLEVWGLRLTSRALGEWRRRVRLERRAEEAAAASKLQRVALGFLGRRRFRYALATRGAIRIQKAARGRAGRRRAGRAREGVRRNAAAAKIQQQATKRGERRRAQRIVALKRGRRAAVQVQKCARGFIGRRKASLRREELRRQRGTVVVQAAWRGLLGRRRAGQRRRDLETERAARNKAAVHIQAAQRRKAARGAADSRRRVRALQRRKSAEFAAVSIQRVARGRRARAAMEAEAARREERQRAAAAVHIQRVARGRVSRKLAASVSISQDVPVLPLPPVQTPTITAEPKNDDNEEDGGLASFSAAEGNGDETVATAEEGGTEAVALPGEDGGEERMEGAGTVPAGLSVEIDHVAELVESANGSPVSANQQQEPSPVAPMSKGEEAARAQAASKIQAVGRGRAARAEARDRKQKRADEEVRRAGVWGQPTDGTNKDSQEKASAASSPPTAAAVAAAKPPPRASSSLFSAGADPRNQAKTTAASSGDQPEAATRIQAAFRGGKARWEADRRREEFHLRKADAVARAQEKRETDAAVRIQTQARARAARAQRERHRQRHAARVGSIRDSGRAAADDLRALSRPGTAAAGATGAAAAGVTADNTAGDAGGEGDGKENVSAWDGAAEALLPISVGMMSMGSMAPAESGWGAVAPKSGGSGSFSLPAAIGVAAVRTPSSVGSPTSVTAAAAAAAVNVASPGKGRGGSTGMSGGDRDGVRRSPGKDRSRSCAVSSPGGGNSSNRSRQASSASVSPAGRSRSPSVASPRRKLSPTRSAPSIVRRSVSSPGFPGAQPQARSRRSVVGHDRRPSTGPKRDSAVSNRGGGAEGPGMGMSLEDVERMHSELRKGIENELNRDLRERIEKELVAKLAEKEEERVRVLKEAEEERRRDKEAFEDAMRAVREAHDKDSEEIARIKARLEEEEATRRAEKDAGRQEYERGLAEIRAEAQAEAEKSRLAVEAVEALRREVEKEAQEQRRRQEEADAQAQAREQEEREEKERRREEEQIKGIGSIDGSTGSQDRRSSAEQQKQQETKEKEEHERLRQQQLEQQQKSVMQQLAAENVERQRVALVQLQAQLRDEEAKRLESHAAWEARQAEEEETAKEERRLELEVIESLKRQLEEGKIRAHQEQELRNAEIRMQMESLRALQEKVQEQERVQLEAERAAQAEQKAKEDAVVREGAKLLQEDEMDFDEDNASDNAGEHGGSGSRGGGSSAGGRRPKSTGTFGSSGSSRGTSAGMVGPAEVEEAVKREIESATGSRLAQVEGALLELSRKQAELESREKQLSETAAAYGGASASPTNTALVSVTTGGARGVDASGVVETEDAVVTPTGAATGVEWVEYWDESAGASYFFNTVTQEASWTNPHEAAVAGGGGGGTIAAAEGGPETLSQPEDGRAKWTECLDEGSGSTYYYNVVTGEAVWEKPAELSRKAETVAGVPQFERPEEWVCYLDENSGEEYWFNVTTGETHWGPT